jgi:hypothetical protein
LVAAGTDESQVVLVLVPVVVRAEPVEVPQRRRPSGLDRLVVIDLEVPVGVAAGDDTFELALDQRAPHPRRDRAAADDLAHLAGSSVTATERRVVDAHIDERVRQ